MHVFIALYAGYLVCPCTILRNYKLRTTNIGWLLKKTAEIEGKAAESKSTYVVKSTAVVKSIADENSSKVDSFLNLLERTDKYVKVVDAAHIVLWLHSQDMRAGLEFHALSRRLQLDEEQNCTRQLNYHRL